MSTWTAPESTGRSPKDTYIVRTAATDAEIDWDAPNNVPLAPDTFETHFAVMVDQLAKAGDVRVRGGDGTIVIDGTIGSGECGWTWQPEVDALSSGYRITVVGTFLGGVAIGCVYRYQVVMTGLPRRSYWIDVAHFEPTYVVKRVTVDAS